MQCGIGPITHHLSLITPLPQCRSLLEIDRLRPHFLTREIGHCARDGVRGDCQPDSPENVVFGYEAQAMMNIIYSSDSYYVVEYPAQHGYELVDKRSARGTFFQGDVADRFVQSLQAAVAEDASVERVDEFLGDFDILLNQPLVVH